MATTSTIASQISKLFYMTFMYIMSVAPQRCIISTNSYIWLVSGAFQMSKSVLIVVIRK